MPQTYLKALPKQAARFIAADARGNKLYSNRMNTQWWLATDSGNFNGTKLRSTAITWYAGVKGIPRAEAEKAWNG